MRSTKTSASLIDGQQHAQEEPDEHQPDPELDEFALQHGRHSREKFGANRAERPCWRYLTTCLGSKTRTQDPNHGHAATELAAATAAPGLAAAIDVIRTVTEVVVEQLLRQAPGRHVRLLVAGRRARCRHHPRLHLVGAVRPAGQTDQRRAPRQELRERTARHEWHAQLRRLGWPPSR